MKSKFLLLFVILLLAPLASFAATAASTGDAEDEWMKTFYKTKDTRPFDAFWKHAIDKNYLEHESASVPLSGFISQVIHQYPELISGRMDDLGRFTKKTRETVVTILWMSDTKQARAILKNHGEDKDLGPSPKITDLPMNSPAALDLCWGYYFATGDTRALDRIISTLENARYAGAMKKYASGPKTEEAQAEAVKEVIFQAAMWSLNSNAQSDPVMARHLQVVASNPLTPRLTALGLQHILRNITGKDTPAGRPATRDLGAEDTDTVRTVNGFSALIFATMDKDWEQKWNTPSEQPFHVTSVSSLRVGEQLALLLLFANPKPDKNENIDVTYDLKITRPNNKVTEQKNLVAGKFRVKDKNLRNIFMAEQLTGFLGEATDPLGEWVFEFQVRDNIRGTVVPLKLKLTLVK